MTTPLFAPLLAQADAGSPLGMLPLILIFFVIFWFMIIRPQQKTQKEHEKFLAGLQKDDLVVTNGGLIGKVVQVADKVLTLEVAPNVKVRVMVAQVSGPFASGEPKAEPAADKASDKK